ncbi:hypothetical protein [Bradyrhizobium sp.]|uniref:hypothetical protein n=1 Tax=Bradyrhizobium sp. TaxID=376 RepID=UPI002606278A|nr:hypothetical protein [Bradyrhizobium sp.]
MSPLRGVYRPSSDEKDELVRLRKLIAETASILDRCPKPDTFLGRKTQEPFPREAAIKNGPVGRLGAVDACQEHRSPGEPEERP